ncbi:FGGY family carbohydrate kinase [Paenibacillus sp. MER TA 81-3]|uniref:FGGY-family carbohydrate kinase n=1 Tax=Paenibacillus sp. MER TA 81-3 TaxID=2939573 RepID=UPI00203EB35D|nr:FGGY family carbohydrate kinase [Paenibacillus sp. MER TA 81-3]MCM3339523.1 FGGY family carbohydrate kinase [Paenibacillus sp. MER TA 81-3]
MQLISSYEEKGNKSMRMMGIDLGTTNRKVGLFDKTGQLIGQVSRPTETVDSNEGFVTYDPEALWNDVATMIRELMAAYGTEPVAYIGITSMAESGLLVNRSTGAVQSLFLPWFETCSAPQAERIRREGTPLELFQRTGLHLSFKHGLAKLLWLKERDPDMFDDAVWLSVSGYIAYRLTGVMACDPTLATRTYAYSIPNQAWDKEWIRHFGLNEDVFPEVRQSGVPLGSVTAATAAALHLPEGAAVAIGGHDHVCAALAVGAVDPGDVYVSMGTAETLVGTIEKRALGQAEFETGLSYGFHVVPGYHFWMGGNASSGGAVEWIRRQLADEALSYEQIKELMVEVNDGPGEAMFFPYLSGSGAPFPNSRTRAALIGLAQSHGKKELLRAVFEGTAYQLEMIRQSAERNSEHAIRFMRAVGGGTRLPAWLQMKADISNITLVVPPIEEATMLGAACAAALGAGYYGNAEEVRVAMQSRGVVEYAPDAVRHERYRQAFEERYVPMAAHLRGLS